MRFPIKPRTVLGVAGGIAAAAFLASALTSPADARSRARKGGPFKLADISVGGFDGVYQNSVIEFTFTTAVDPASINHSVFQVRQRNATGTGFTKEVPGSFQSAGSIVRFYPRLPTHLRDPASLTGEFYVPGTEKDNALLNAGFKPETDYECRVIGAPAVQAARSTRGRRLDRTSSARFRTSKETPKSYAYTIDTYGDAPPPGFQYSNPSDKVASVADEYAAHGGTSDVPSAISVSLYGNKVPLSPSSVRAGSNVSLQLTERFGDPQFAKAIPGASFVEQSFETMLLSFKPQFPLPDRGVYALKVSKNVKDLTEQYDFRNNAERLRLREIYEYLQAAQAQNPGASADQLPDPPPELIYDWSPDVDTRTRYKENILELGATYPEEVDPRVMVLFSTRDEPVTNGSIALEFVKSDGYFDDVLSTASWDEIVPGAASAILTISGGSGVDGDYIPATSQTINVDGYPNRTINWRRLRIPPGVVLTLTGTRPATIKALEIQIDGELRADGKGGENASTGSYTALTGGKPAQVKGGLGGPGGGAGGDCANEWKGPPYGGDGSNLVANGTGKTGNPGIDATGTTAAPGDGGQGGLGGSMGSGTYYCFGAAGGGGGSRTAGSGGATGGYTFYPSWNGKGGNGGAGSSNDDLDPLVGGAGGGAGGNSLFNYPSYLWAKNAGGGGGGGGALLVQTSAVFNVGSTGAVRARGGVGGNGTGNASTLNAGPGGGAGGGSLLLRSSKGFNLAAPTTFYDVRGGAGGTHSGTYTSSPGGTGGTGYIRIEDPNGGVQVPGGSVGSYDPVGGGVASYVYTRWVDLGVDQPRILNFSDDDFLHSAAGNDAILIEMQMAVEDSSNFGSPLLTALNPDQSTSDPLQVSDWAGIRITDLTGIPGGAFGPIDDYDPASHGSDYIIPVADKLNGRNYKFFRVRVTFQLDGSQSSRDPFPFLDRLVLNFQFNT